MNSSSKNHTCPEYIFSYIRDLTSSYTNKSNESTMVAASVIMFVLAGLFFILNLFSGVSDVSATLDPKVRLFLTSALSLFLPVMSYLFSEAKNAGYLTNPGAGRGVAYLSLRAELILAWMLLVELLRKKVDEIRVSGYSATIQRAGRVIWLGNLVFFNIGTISWKVVFSILWMLCATKLLQRLAFTEAGKRWYAHGKNALVLSSYMAQMLQQDHHEQHLMNADDVEEAVPVGKELLKRCDYIVMGEEMLVEEATANGYKLNKINPDSGIITVRKVWELGDKDKLFTSLDKNQHLKRLCLSFSLFKLLCRRFERLPAMTSEEARNSRDLILKGLYNNGETTAEALFQVMSDEVTFLSEYYHSVVPVVLASPFFLLANYFLLPIVVTILCLMTIVICGNGDVSDVINSIRIDNTNTLHSSFADIVTCLVSRSPYSPAAFFSIVDLSITILLFVIFFYEELWEFFVFLLSNWFIVSQVCNYIAKPHWHEKPIYTWAFRIILWLRSKLSDTSLRFKQLSLLDLRWPLHLPLFSIPFLVVKTELVPKSLKRSVIEYLVEHDCGTPNYTPLTNGKSALQRNNLFDQLSWACESDGVAEVILTWHIATCILELKCPPRSKEEATLSRVAIRLSKYCAYLVAFHPELLPDDNREKAGLLLEDMKKELKSILGCRNYYVSSRHKRVDKILERTQVEETEDSTDQSEIQLEATGRSDQNKVPVIMNGAKLGRSLMTQANGGLEMVWKVLADVWTELIVFVAPSTDDNRLKGHDEVLVQGEEFITVLWALATHIGISRSANI
ncbi:hypothetical protein ACP4OV_017137 [Aristida adscensionis]